MPKLTIAALAALVASPAEDPVLYVDEDERLTVGPAAHAGHANIVLRQEALVDLLGASADDGVEAQWNALDENFSQEHVLEHLRAEAEEGIERVLAERRDLEDQEADVNG
ncbi:hypothetical protein [Streptomyces sp. NPDC004435]|uniref:hypothetical protein n=1 Tax=Streptomyces sp. NPDC004435 TaxID=3364701 RepID=UPI0036ADE5A3